MMGTTVRRFVFDSTAARATSRYIRDRMGVSRLVRDEAGKADLTAAVRAVSRTVEKVLLKKRMNDIYTQGREAAEAEQRAAETGTIPATNPQPEDATPGEIASAPLSGLSVRELREQRGEGNAATPEEVSTLRQSLLSNSDPTDAEAVMKECAESKPLDEEGIQQALNGETSLTQDIAEEVAEALRKAGFDVEKVVAALKAAGIDPEKVVAEAKARAAQNNGQDFNARARKAKKAKTADWRDSWKPRTPSEAALRSIIEGR